MTLLNFFIDDNETNKQKELNKLQTIKLSNKFQTNNK
jgi:hypothetical protein